MSEDREQLLSLVNSCQDKIRELQQENKQLKRNIEIKNAYKSDLKADKEVILSSMLRSMQRDKYKSLKEISNI